MEVPALISSPLCDNVVLRLRHIKVDGQAVDPQLAPCRERSRSSRPHERLASSQQLGSGFTQAQNLKTVIYRARNSNQHSDWNQSRQPSFSVYRSVLSPLRSGILTPLRVLSRSAAGFSFVKLPRNKSQKQAVSLTADAFRTDVSVLCIRSSPADHAGAAVTGKASGPACYTADASSSWLLVHKRLPNGVEIKTGIQAKNEPKRGDPTILQHPRRYSKSCT